MILIILPFKNGKNQKVALIPTSCKNRRTYLHNSNLHILLYAHVFRSHLGVWFETYFSKSAIYALFSYSSIKIIPHNCSECTLNLYSFPPFINTFPYPCIVNLFAQFNSNLHMLLCATHASRSPMGRHDRKSTF